MEATYGNPGPPPRERLSREQDLAAELFRVRDRLRLAVLDAEAFYSRSLELERQLEEVAGRLAAESVLREILQQRQLLSDEIRALTRQLADVEARRAEEARLLACYRQVAECNTRELTRVLSSKSWALTRPLRRVVQVLRGRPFSEPQAAKLDWLTSTVEDPQT